MNYTELNQDDNIRALANYLQVKYSEAESMIDNEEYGVYTEEEANELCGDYIRETLWAFNYSFLCRFSDIVSAIPESAWTKMAGELCEDFNEAVYAMVTAEYTYDDFVQDCINEDGYGHFLNSYDGNHVDSDDECTCNLDETYIIVKLS